MRNNPLVSIIVIGNNESQYLDKCYESILRQSYKNIEVVYRDNDSSDDSYEKSVGYSKLFKNEGMSLTIFKNKKKYSYSKCIGMCMANIEGDYLYIMSPKNRMESSFIQEVVNNFEDEKVGWVVCSMNKQHDGEIIDSRIVKYNEDIVGRLLNKADLWVGQVVRRCNCDVRWTRYNYTFEIYKHIYESFLIGCVSEHAIIEKPLLMIECDSALLDENECNMMFIIERHLMYLAAFESARKMKKKEIESYAFTAIEGKVSLCMAEALRVYSFGEYDLAKKYLQMAKVFDIQIEYSDLYKQIEKIIAHKDTINKELIEWCKSEGVLCQM